MEGLEKILIVEDDPTIGALLEMALNGAGYRETTLVRRGDEAMTAIVADPPDLILLDVMLPGLDGFSIARRVRENPALGQTRIIMITARTQAEDICRGLDSGADDYVTKPFDRKVLLARVAAVLRRGAKVIEGRDFDGLKIDEAARMVKLRGEEVKLTAGEFALLVKLVAHQGRILRRDADERTVDVQVAALRRKLGEWSDHIETIRGIGYRVK